MTPLELLALFRALALLGSGMAEAVSHISALLEATAGRDLGEKEISAIMSRAGISAQQRKDIIAAME